MNFPVIAKKSFDENKDKPEFFEITNLVVNALKNISDPIERARTTHQIIDQFNISVFNHPLVKEFSPCKQSCSACCHTQVSVNADEAKLLVDRIIEDEIEIDINILSKQSSAKNSSEEFFSLSYQDRKCVFLDENQSCTVYSDRPSVCRTNAVIGESSQCETSGDQRALRLVKTVHSDMAIIGSYLASSEAGVMAHMILNELISRSKNVSSGFLKNLIKKSKVKKIFKESTL